MAQITKYVEIKFGANLYLNETEIRALDALVGYGTEPFLKMFYDKLGKSYMQPYENGLTTLFENIRSVVHPAIGEINRTRQVIKESEVLKNK